MGIEIAVCAAILLSAALFGSLWRRLPSWTLVDLFMLAIALYFGVYTLVDAATLQAFELDPLIVVSVFLIVVVGSMVLWLATQVRAFPETALARLQADWRACPPAPVVAIVGLAVAFRWYTSAYFSELGMLGEQDLAAVEKQLPYWYTSLSMIVSTSIFGAGICSWGKVGIARGWRRIFWLAMTAASGAIMLGMGRRATFAFLIIIAWTILTEQRSKRARWASVALIALAMPLLVGFSNLYQAYRAVTYRGVVLENVISDDNIGSLIEEAVAVERTVANLRERQALWRFNYEILQAHIEGKGRLQWGQILLSDVPNYVPAVFSPRKEWIDTEDIVLQKFDLDPYDRASNLFAYTYADFGALAGVAAPALMLLFVWACAVVLRWLRDPFLRAILMGMAISYAINLETGYLVPIGIARDFLIVSLLYIAARGLVRTARGAARPHEFTSASTR